MQMPRPVGCYQASMIHPRKLLQTNGLRAKRALGQNFLIHTDVAERMAGVLFHGVNKQCPVLEIGPGLGALTQALVAHASQLIAVEKDKALAQIIETQLAPYKHVQIKCEDIMDFDFNTLPKPILVTGNLPYNIASPLLFMLLQQQRQHMKRMLLMFQKEVATRIMAKPGTKAYGILAILAQVFTEAKLEFNLSASQFYPQPKVSSAVIGFEILPQPRVVLHDEALFFELAHACLAHRRKTLRNNLIPWLSKKMDKNQAVDLVEELPIDLKRRGETLSLQELSDLTRDSQQALSAHLE